MNICDYIKNNKTVLALATNNKPGMIEISMALEQR